ncbi:MarR family transcriptional regulator [Rhodoplanes serenus]|uniref:MarR family transcriptional regulator n=2 Tax=Rhodoplanes serenus TaxID=200615 RepID=A0A9X5ATU1_9BRAD|nr:MarR family transcriptional regulator [Rhodoplanes serenus]
MRIAAVPSSDLRAAPLDRRSTGVARGDVDAMDRFIAEWGAARPDLDVRYLATLGRILRLSAHLRDAVDGWLRPFGLTWDVFDLIVTLQRSGRPEGLRPTALTDACLLSSGAMTSRIDRVEKLGLAERRPDPDDRRATRVALTRRGARLAARAMAEHAARSRHIADQLTPAEQDELAQLLRKLLRSFESEVPPADGHDSGSA